MLRPLTVNYPDGGQDSYTYFGAAYNFRNWQVAHLLSSGTYQYVVVQEDSMGRTQRIASENAESNPWDQQDTCYDALGRVSFTSYPFQGSGFGMPLVCSGAGDAVSYDALGRPLQMTHSDNSSVQYTYTGRATQISDEGNGTASVTRIFQNDGLGRLTATCEVSATTLPGTGGSPVDCALDQPGSGFVTTYGYDLLNNLTSANQSGVARSWGYDSLSRLTSESIPESWGPTTYSYNSDGLLSTRVRPSPNQPNPTVTTTTTYSYDEMHRLLWRRYSDSTTPDANFYYDEPTPQGQTSVNQIGQMTTAQVFPKPYPASPLVASYFPVYDGMGRVKLNSQCLPGSSCSGSGLYALNYTYDLAGDVVTASNGVGVTYTAAYNSGGRLTTLASSLNDSQHPGTLLSNVHYGPFGVISDQLGNGLLETTAYNGRGFATNNSIGQAHTTFATNTAPFGWLDAVSNAYNSGSTSLPQWGTVSLTGWAADNEDGSPVARVSIDVDGTPIGDATLGTYRPDVGNYYNRSDYNYSGYSFTGNIGGPTVGTHTVHATAYDWAGNASLLSGSTAITVTGNQAPFGYLDNAYNQANPGNSTIPQGGTLYVSGWAVDPDSNPGAPVNKVEIRVDGSLWGTATLGGSRPDVASAYNRPDYTNSGWSQTFNIGNLSPGTHTVTATAYDSLGGSAVVIDDHQFTVTGSNPGTPAAPAGPILYSYDLYYAGNGNVVTGRDLVNGVWNYSYDGFNRLAGAQQPGQGFNYTYDRFGNRWNQTLTNGQGPQPQYTFDNGNHIQNSGSGVYYDALGNVTNDGLGNTYTYDAENRLASVDGTTYVYDALGRRVAKQSGGANTETYLYDLSNRVETIFNSSGVWAYGEIYVGGRHLGTYSGGTTNFLHSDWLGSKRAITSVTGALTQTCMNSPFGDGGNCTGTNWNYNNFTDDFHDNEDNTEHTQFRQLSTVQGRWLSPDPYMGSMDLTNPQSLNRYAYVMNGPMNATDPSGLIDLPDFRLPDDGGGGGMCSPFADPEDIGFGCIPILFPPVLIGGGGGGHGSGTGSGSGTPTQGPGWTTRGKPPLSGETLGIPNTVHIHIPSILFTLGLAPNDPACDFIACGTEVGQGFDLHHVFAQEFRDWFEQHGIDIDKYLIEMSAAAHRLLPNGIHTKAGGNWNGVWRQWIKDHPNATPQEIMNQARKMLADFGIVAGDALSDVFIVANPCVMNSSAHYCKTGPSNGPI